MINVTVLMKSGRSISTTHNWEELKGIIHENPSDEEMVIQVVVEENNGETLLQWASIRKDCIEGFLNL